VQNETATLDASTYNLELFFFELVQVSSSGLAPLPTLEALVNQTRQRVTSATSL
jgi:hypothetical protein